MYYTEKELVFFYAETPLHPGAATGIGFIDLPVQREVFSGLPTFPASGLKGAMRDYFERQSDRHGNGIGKKEVLDVFGPAPGRGADHAGAVTLTDAKLLLFPVRSLYGVFSYITCPLALKRLLRDLEIAGWPPPEELKELSVAVAGLQPAGDELIVIDAQDNEQSVVAHKSKDGKTGAVLDEYAFRASPKEDARFTAKFIRDHCLPNQGVYKEWMKGFPSRFAVVPDDVFADFTRLGAEVITRNRIDDNTGTVSAEEGGLWTEEHLPSETVLYSAVLCGKPLKCNALTKAEEVSQFVKLGLKKNGQSIMGLDNQRLQIGGNQTVGRGLVMVHFLEQS